MLAAEAAFGDPFSSFPPQEKARNTERERIKYRILKQVFLNTMTSKKMNSVVAVTSVTSNCSCKQLQLQATG